MPFVFNDEYGAGFYEVSGWEGARGVFTTRRGGVSPHPFDSLNMGAGSGDSPGNVKKNRELLTAALGLPGAEIKLVRQVHGDDIYVLREPGSGIPGEAGQKRAKGHDALMTDLKRVPIGVLTADCVPILLYDPKKSVVAAVHAGWAGTAKG
ncbi:MAG: polyphenol oxidase family protein, partial [Nitrospirota bacterium]